MSSFTSMITFIPCLADILFFSFMPITYEIVHIYASIHNAQAYEVLNESHKYFLKSNHISSLQYIQIDLCIHTYYTCIHSHLYIHTHVYLDVIVHMPYTKSVVTTTLQIAVPHRLIYS